MSQLMEGMSRVIFIGIGATMVMDLWLLLLKQLGIPTLNLALVGRWIGNFGRGKWNHEGIAQTPPIRGELLLGWAGHYVIGIAFAALLVCGFSLEWARNPTFIPALLVGVGTVVVPLFIMQPAMGAGIASSRTATPMRNCVRSLINHTAFGVGLYLAAVATALLI